MSDIPPPPGSGPPPPPPSSGFPPPPPAGAYGAPPPGYSTTYGTAAPVHMELAGVMPRFGAALLDGVITLLMWIPAIIAITSGPKRITTCSVDDEGNVTIGEPINAFCEVPTNGTIAVAVLLAIVALAGTILYYTLPIGRSGQTVGKKAVGVRVVDGGNGLPIGNGRALGRYLFSVWISGPVCLLGFLWAIWDPRKQTWHDKVASSVVTKA